MLRKVKDQYGKTYFIISICIIFIFSFALRMSLALHNQYANDNHYQVVEIMQKNGGRIPSYKDCLQCYHPPFYYVTTYQVIKYFTDEKTTAVQKEHLGQYLNVIAGMVMLIIIFFFLKKISTSRIVIFMTFLLIALNPRLIAINIQMTNDSFEILFSTLAIFFLFRYREKKSVINIAMTALSVVLALITKGTGFVLVFYVFIVLATMILTSILYTRNQIKTLLQHVMIFTLIVAIFTISFGPYYKMYKDTGSLFTINREKSPPAHLFNRTFINKKTGVTSLYDAYGTFRIIGLIKYPLMDRAEKIRPSTLPRTSLWTNLYARSQFIQYEKRPRGWKTKDWNITLLGKVIYVFGLVPLGITLLGFFLIMRNIWNAISKKALQKILESREIFILLGVIIFISFIIKFTYDYRSFVSMKIIYIFPGMLLWVYIFSKGFANFLRICTNQLLRNVVLGAVVILVCLYILDVYILLKTIIEHIQ